MVIKMDVGKPKTLKCSDADITKTFDEGDFHRKRCTGSITREYFITDNTIDECIFDKVDFTPVVLERVELIDVEFNDCDLSNKRFDFQPLHRVIFKNCKLYGTSFIDSSLKDVVFDNCKSRYLNLSGSKLRNVIFKSSDFTEASFSGTECKGIYMENVKFEKAEFMRANFNGVDFSKSSIDGAYFDLDTLKGIAVNPSQCVLLASMLGVIVKDE